VPFRGGGRKLNGESNKYYWHLNWRSMPQMHDAACNDGSRVWSNIRADESISETLFRNEINIQQIASKVKLVNKYSCSVMAAYCTVLVGETCAN
jgi:hypothetical protein